MIFAQLATVLEIVFSFEGEGRRPEGRRPEHKPGDGRDRAEREDVAHARDHGATPLPREGIQQGERLGKGAEGSDRVRLPMRGSKTRNG